MPVRAKICGVNSAAAMDAVAAGDAAFVGLMFVPRSPRYVTVAAAKELAAMMPRAILRTGVFLDPTDALLDEVLAALPLDVIQLHGSETPARVAEVKARTKRAVMKAVSIGSAADVAGARAFEAVADWLLFDAKPPKNSALPGGNAVAFDWTLLAGSRWKRPWMLSGGLTPENVGAAVAATDATVVDVSSGVEDAPGRKSPIRIKQFLETVRGLK